MVNKRTLKKITKILIGTLLFYGVYVFLFGILLFRFQQPTGSVFLAEDPSHRFIGEKLGPDRVALVEGGYEAGLARIDLIEGAESTLDIAYYALHDDMASQVFWGLIFEAADKGVQVRIVLDGIFHNLRGDARDTLYACVAHPNIELKFYEAFTFLHPWRWNNRLHDKFIVVDNQLAILGGRNIGDRYFSLEEYESEAVRDRDVVVLNTQQEDFSHSGIQQIQEYFHEVWHHAFTQYPLQQLSRRQEAKAQERIEYFRSSIETLKATYPHLFHHKMDWWSMTLPTNKVSLIYNPLQRFNKEPWVWHTIVGLMENAEESIFIQSPYVIPTKSMLDPLSQDQLSSKEITMLTNSLASSPNYLAMSGYQRHRKKLVDYGIDLFEYHGEGSIHAKSLLLDDRISLVGSFNIDARSVYLSAETMFVIDSEEFAEALKTEVDHLLEESLLVGKDYSYNKKDTSIKEREVPLVKRVLVRILSGVTYFFDYML